jgi:hypothetical protein
MGRGEHKAVWVNHWNGALWGSGIVKNHGPYQGRKNHMDAWSAVGPKSPHSIARDRAETAGTRAFCAERSELLALLRTGIRG